MARETTEQLVQRRKLEDAAERKAREIPHELTTEDLGYLPASMVSEAAASGQLRHLGFGPDKRRRVR